MTRSIIDGPRLHVVHASVRGREQDNRYGGSAAPIDLGIHRLGEAMPIEAPASFNFGQRTHDTVRQTTIGVGYEGRWREAGEASVGIQRTNYEKEVDQPNLPRTATRDEPWLLNATLAA